MERHTYTHGHKKGGKTKIQLKIAFRDIPAYSLKLRKGRLFFQHFFLHWPFLVSHSLSSKQTLCVCVFCYFVALFSYICYARFFPCLFLSFFLVHLIVSLFFLRLFFSFFFSFFLFVFRFSFVRKQCCSKNTKKT